MSGKTYTVRDFRTDVISDWCPGCGDFGILRSVQRALAELSLPPHEVAVFSGIGCSGKTPHYIGTYGLHTLHGRVLPVATGARLANNKLTVLAVGGDGDAYGIGAGYFVNAGRRNIDLTYIVFDNEVYGLTKGQASPTMRKGMRTKGMAEESIVEAINPIALALSAGYTFIARGYALDVKHLVGLIKRAIQHPGLALIDVLQTCPTYNNLHTQAWFAGKDRENGQPRIYHLEETGYDPLVHDPEDDEEIVAKKAQALARSFEGGDRIPIGVFYQLRTLTLDEQLARRRPRLREQAQAEMDVYSRDITPLLEQFA
jgi:2-oxoglutarate ferredoxin oxidoreductase subunit beta